MFFDFKHDAHLSRIVLYGTLINNYRLVYSNIWDDIILVPIDSLMLDILNGPFCDARLACPHLAAIA